MLLRVFLFSLVLQLAAPVGAAEPDCNALLGGSRIARVVEKVRQFFWGVPAKNGTAENEVPDRALPETSVPEFSLPEFEIGRQVSMPVQGPSDSYQVRNKKADEGPPSKADAQRLSTFQVSGVRYYGLKAFGQVGAVTGLLQVGRYNPFVTAHASGPDLIMTVHADALAENAGVLAVPFGYQPRAALDGVLEIETHTGSLIYKRRAAGDARIALQAIESNYLNTETRRELTNATGAPSLYEYPLEIRKAVEDLQSEWKNGLDNMGVARKLAKFIQESFTYEMDDGDERGTIALCRKGSVQCDGAGLILTTILRSIFQIPSYPVAGYISVGDAADTTVSVIHDQLTPHLFVAVFDEATRRFFPVDPTPSEQTREKEHEGKEDPRFTDWPPEDEDASGEDQPGDEESDESKGNDENKEGEASAAEGDPSEDGADADKEMAESSETQKQDGKKLKPANPKPTKKKKEIVDPEVLLTELWKDVLAQKQKPALRGQLENIAFKLGELRGKQILRADHEGQLRTVTSVLEILPGLPEKSLLALTRGLADRFRNLEERDPADLHRLYLSVQAVSQLMPVLSRYSDHQLGVLGLGRRAQVLLDELAKGAAKVPGLEEQLPGQISKEELRRGQVSAYPRQRFEEIARVAKLIQLRRDRLERPLMSFRRELSPYRSDIDDDEISTAEDFEHYGSFLRDGLPPSLDAARVVAGDMRYHQSFEDVEVASRRAKAKTEKRREVTYILYDLSTSMNHSRKGELRDLIIQTWIDELATGPNAQINLVGYSDTPLPPLELKDQDQARRMFRQMMAALPYFKNIAGNDTTLALKSVLEKIKQLPKDLKTVNIRIITDGEETYDADVLRNIKTIVGKETALNLSGVTLLSGNDKLKRFIEDSAQVNLVREGVFVHVSHDEAAAILRPVTAGELNQRRDHLALPLIPKSKIRDFVEAARKASF